MLIMSLKEEQAAALLKHMSDTSLAKLRKAAESLDVAEIGNEEKRDALQGFLARRRTGGFFLGDADDRFRKVLARAKGEEGMLQFYAAPEDQEEGAPKEQSCLEVIQAAPDEQLASVLAKDSSRCAAALLSSLSGERSGRVLAMLEEEQRDAIVERMVTAEAVPAEVLREVMDGVREKLEELASGGEVASGERRAQDLARMIGAMDKEAQERVLSHITQRDPDLGEQVERLLFGFADLPKVGGKSMQELVRKLEESQIALALKGASEQIQEHFYGNMSERARERVDEEREMAGRVPLSQVEAAREEIMKIARKMYREGELVVEMGGEQYVE